MKCSRRGKSTSRWKPHNGGITVANVRGELAFERTNGGISIDSVAGNVRGRTTNGGVDATLAGNTWDGAGLDLRTTNGGVRLRVPDDYSARLETGTVNGGIDIDFPVTVQGRIGREFSTTLGDGGPLVRARPRTATCESHAEGRPDALAVSFLDSVGRSRLSDTLRGFRQALRGLLKAPVFTLTAIGTLGLAIGANAAIFTLVDTVLLDPLPYRDADRLVVLKGSAPGTRLGENFNLAPEFFLEYQEQADLLESVGSLNFNTYTLRADERVERVWMSNASLSLFETLGVMPQLGRLPTPEEGSQAAVISHQALARLVWRRPECASAAATRWPARCARSSASCRRTSISRARTCCSGSRTVSTPRVRPITPGQFGLPVGRAGAARRRARGADRPARADREPPAGAIRRPGRPTPRSSSGSFRASCRCKEELLGPLARPALDPARRDEHPARHRRARTSRTSSSPAPSGSGATSRSGVPSALDAGT